MIKFKDISLLDEQRGLLQHCDLLVEDQTIVAITPASHEEADTEQREGEFVYSGQARLLLPAFYNIHCHVPMTLLRGRGEGLPLQRWLSEKIFPFERQLTAEDCYWASLHGIMEMLASGVASFTDMYFFIESIAEAVLDSGIKANLSHGLTFPGDPADERVDFRSLKGVQDTLHLAQKVKELSHDRVQVDVGVHAEYTSGPWLMARAADLAEELNLGIHVHVSETEAEHAACRERYGLTPTALMQKAGLWKRRSTVAHGVYLEDGDLDILAAADVTLAHCVSSNLKLGSGIINLRRVQEAGLAVGIGTDGASSNNNLNMLEELHLASLLQKGLLRDSAAFGPACMLSMASRAGAHSQGREDSGGIAVGKRADLIMIDLQKGHMQPTQDMLSNVLYAADRGDLAMTMVDGRVLYEKGQFLTIDEERVLYEIKRIQQRIENEIQP